MFLAALTSTSALSTWCRSSNKWKRHPALRSFSLLTVTVSAIRRTSLSSFWRRWTLKEIFQVRSTVWVWLSSMMLSCSTFWPRLAHQLVTLFTLKPKTSWSTWSTILRATLIWIGSYQSHLRSASKWQLMNWITNQTTQYRARLALSKKYNRITKWITFIQKWLIMTKKKS